MRASPRPSPRYTEERAMPSTVETASDADIVALLQSASTATLTSVMAKQGIQHVFMYGVSPLPGSAPRMVGRAFTMRSVAVREDVLTQDKARPPEVNIQRRAAEECGPGEVLVIDC